MIDMISIFKNNSVTSFSRITALSLVVAAAGWMASNPAHAAADNTAVRVPERMQPLSTAAEFVPMKRSAAAATVAATRVDLGAWTGTKSASEAAGNVVKIGATRTSAASATVQGTNALLRWQASSRGGLVSALTFASEEAFGMRLGVLIDALPASALLRVYQAGYRSEAFEISGQRVNQIIENNLKAGDRTDAGRTWWTPGFDGEEVTLEIELPPGTSADGLRIAVPRIVHLFDNLTVRVAQEDDIQLKIGNSGDCMQDSTCYDRYSAQRDAVARMLFVRDDGAYLCTGTLLNDRTGSGTPFFLTANHCISSQAMASTLQTFWFYRSPTCGARTLSADSKTLTNGATLLFSAQVPDVTLLKLNDTPPAGAMFAGWDATAKTAGTSGAGIHHPAGDLQKISIGRIVGTAACTPEVGAYNCQYTDDMTENFYRVEWSSGAAQGGSSGSGYFVNGLLTGVLSTSNANCSNKGGINNYSRFDRIFPLIKRWIYAGSSSSASTTQGTYARAAVYSFYNPLTGARFYTASAEERDYLISLKSEYQYENTAFYASAAAGAGLTPVFRFYNTASGAHFYTDKTAERDLLLNLAGTYQYDGIGWYSPVNADNGAVAEYRFYSAGKNTHLYTSSTAERDAIIARGGYQLDGVSFHVWPQP